jgi:hypothetical protein
VTGRLALPDIEKNKKDRAQNGFPKNQFEPAPFNFSGPVLSPFFCPSRAQPKFFLKIDMVYPKEYTGLHEYNSNHGSV